MTFRAGNKGHGVNFRFRYFTDSSSIFLPDLSGKQSQYLENLPDLCVNAGVSSSFCDRIRDEGRALAPAILSHLICSSQERAVYLIIGFLDFISMFSFMSQMCNISGHVQTVLSWGATLPCLMPDFDRMQGRGFLKIP